jgi:hypothetical protein
MPRPVAVRVDYRNDAGFLLRFDAAVSKDDRQTADWRKETSALIRQLVLRLLEADASRSTEKEKNGKGNRSSLKTA